ncbi:VOC family protein [Halobacillus fulvus]|nr:VOC family protein [Halobacillus fulvus]
MSFHRKPVTYVQEVQLNVQNLELSLRYYQDIIGLQILERTFNGARLTADGKTCLLVLTQPEDVVAKPQNTTGLYHFALLVPTRKDLAYFVRHLAANEVRIASSDHLVSEALYLNDPDGNGIEIYADRDPKEWTWKNERVAMAVDPLDFEDLLKEGNPNEPWQGLPAGTVMGHIHLHVSHLERAKAFYTDGLGFDIVSRLGDQALFISSGKYHHHIGLNTWAGVGAPEPPANSVGLDFFTIVLPDEEHRKELVERLGRIGVTVTEEDDVFVTKDPSGNGVRLVV